MALQRTFRRTLAVPPGEAYQPLIDGIPGIKDCTIVDAGNPIRVNRKRNILANRWAMSATISIDKQDLVITIDGNGTAPIGFADQLFALLPPGAIDDHGLAAAREAMAGHERLFAVLELQRLLDDLRAGEEVIQLISCLIDDQAGLVVLTTKRLLLKNKAAWDSSTQEILPQQVTSISTGTKRYLDWVELTVSNRTITIGGMSVGRGNQLAEHIRRLRDGEHSAAPTPTEPAATSPVEPPAPAAGYTVADLPRLAELHAQGILTDEEFAAAKAKVLGL